MKIKQKMLVLAVMMCFMLPTFAQGVTYYGDLRPENDDDVFIMQANDKSNDGDIYCLADNDWGIRVAYALYYILVTPTSSGDIEIGVDWDLHGTLENGFWISASWTVYYFWVEEDNLWDISGAALHHSTWNVDSDESDAFFGDKISTSADWSSSSKFTQHDDVTAYEEICVGLWIRFDVSGDARIYDTVNWGYSLHLNIDSITWNIA